MQARSVLILAHDFPPLNSIGGRRPYSWFQYFPACGIRPIVITKSWEESSGTVQDIASQRGANAVIREETDLRTIIRVPIRTTWSEKLLARFGINRFVFLRKALTFFSHILSYSFFSFDKNRLIFKEARKFLKENSVDFIIATGEPFILFKYAYRLHREFKIPWIADFRDGWYLNHVTAQRTSIATIFLWQWEYFFEKKYISSCDFIISVDPILSNKLESLHRIKAHVIYNGFEKIQEKKISDINSGLPLLLCHGGTLYPGHQAEALLQAVDELDKTNAITPNDLKLQFIGVEFYPEQFDRVMNFSTSSRKYLETTKRIPRDEAIEKLRAADFLVVFTDRWTPVLPTKMYEYLASRRPVMVVLNDHSILTELIGRLKAGVALDSVEDLRKFLLQKIEAKRNHLPLFDDELDVDQAMEYSREAQAKKLASLLHGHQ